MKLPSMCYRRLRGDLIEVFKYTHNIYKLSDSLLELESRTNTSGHSYKLKKQMQYNAPAALFHTENRGWME